MFFAYGLVRYGLVLFWISGRDHGRFWDSDLTEKSKAVSERGFESIDCLLAGTLKKDSHSSSICQPAYKSTPKEYNHDSI